jgi:hypothetical protein
MKGTTFISEVKFLIQGLLIDVLKSRAKNERIKKMGRNEYALSNIHQWLNSEGRIGFIPCTSHRPFTFKRKCKKTGTICMT